MSRIVGLPVWAWLLLGLALLTAMGLAIWRFLRRRRDRRAIDNVIGSVAYDMLRNVLLPTGTGEQLHVNYLLLTQRGILVADLFDVPGMIFAGEKMEQWSVLGPKKHFMFTNPLPMLYDRVACVRALAGEVPVDGRIVFTMRGDFPKGRPSEVLRLDSLQDEYAVVERGPGSAAAAFAPVWDEIKRVAQPNPLAG